MRRQQQVRTIEQRVVRRQRLHVEHVENSAADPVRSQRIDEGTAETLASFERVASTTVKTARDTTSTAINGLVGGGSRGGDVAAA